MRRQVRRVRYRHAARERRRPENRRRLSVVASDQGLEANAHEPYQGDAFGFGASAGAVL